MHAIMEITLCFTEASIIISFVVRSVRKGKVKVRRPRMSVQGAELLYGVWGINRGQISTGRRQSGSIECTSVFVSSCLVVGDSLIEMDHCTFWGILSTALRTLFLRSLVFADEWKCQ